MDAMSDNRAMAIQTGQPIAGERLGFDCTVCGHRHQGERFGFICIGCPCVNGPSTRDEVEPLGSSAASLDLHQQQAEPCVWRDIATAPEGALLLFCSMVANVLCESFYVDWLVDGRLCSGAPRSAPTHWMPLPSPPSRPLQVQR